MKKQLILLLGFAISAVSLYYALKGIPLGRVVHTLGQGDLRWIAVAVFLYIVAYTARTLRWKILMSPIRDVAFYPLVAPLFIGFFANNILPFRMGEFVRAHLSGRKFGISRTASLGTIFIERIFDTISFLTTFLCAALFYPFPVYIEHGAAMLGIGCIIACGGLWMVATHRALFETWVHRFGLPNAWALKLEGIVQNFAHGISGLQHAHKNASALALSLGIWFLEGSTLLVMARAYHLDVSLPGAFFLLFFLGLAVTLPQAPGYVGTMELFGVKALTILHIPRDEGLSLILAVHGFQFLFILGWGLWALHHEGLTVGKLWEAQESL